MSVVLLSARLLLVAMFLVAAVAKLADREGSRRAVRQFGVPDALSSLIGTLLPLSELAVASALIASPTVRWGAAGALVLLTLFIVAVGLALSRGRQPDCHCFGQIYSASAGRATLGRNVVLAGVAGFVLLAGWDSPGASATSWLDQLSVGALVGAGIGAALLGAQAWFSWQLLRQNGRLMTRLDSLEASLSPDSADRPGLLPGSSAPRFALPSVNGGTMTLQNLLACGPAVLLVFSDPSCGACVAMAPEIAEWQRSYADQLTVAVISRAGDRPHIEGGDDDRVALQADREIADAYRAPGVPAAVLVDSTGLVASQLAVGRDRIHELVAGVISPQNVGTLTGTVVSPGATPGGSDPSAADPRPALKVAAG